LTGPCLYRRLLGSDFDRMPEVLRRFHDSVGGGASATGVVRVRRGSRALARALARTLRLPPEGDGVAVMLRVTEVAEHERWERTFGSWRWETRQWLEGGRLIERMGAAKFVFDIAADERGMRFRSVRVAWLGVPVPRGIAVEVEGNVRGFDTEWEIAVVVRAPRLGVITSYEGRITPTS